MTHQKYEQTLVIIKPDGIHRSLIGALIGRFERIGLKLVAIKMFVPTVEMIEKHYTLDPQWRRITGEKRIKAARDRGEVPPSEDPLEITRVVLEKLKKYMTSGPVVAMVWQGAHAIKIVRKLVGNTEPLASDVGSIRGDFVLDSYEMADQDGRSVRNILHASGSVKEANDEIKHWFKESEVMNYKLVQEQIIYAANLENIF